MNVSSPSSASSSLSPLSSSSSSSATNISNLGEKILKYETFLNEQLKPDLKATLEARDRVYSDIAEYLALKNSINAIQAAKLKPKEPLKTKVDLGCNFYVQAHVDNPEKLFLEIGLGFFLEFSQDEALAFIEKKSKVLEDKAKTLTDESCKIRANIKLTLEGLRELQNICQTDPKQRPAHRDVFA